jgi:hypothetical protein
VPFFKPLLSIGVTIADLSGISEEGRIRIEKKLIAEQRLNQTFAKNDTEQILKVLKDFPDVLREVASYNCFYGILTGYDAEFIDTVKRYSAAENARIQHVVSDYFRDELIEYINLNISANNWNNVRVLLHYRQFLSAGIVKIISVRLEQKIEYALALISKQPQHGTLRSEIGWFNTDEFYQMLGETSNRDFVQPIVKIIDTIQRNKQYTAGTAYFDKLLKALYNYDYQNKVLRQVIASAHIKNGALKSKTYTLWAIMLIMIVGPFVVVFSTSSDNSNNENTYTQSGEPGSDLNFGRSTDDSLRGDQKLKMEHFVEARIYPLNYPIASWKTSKIVTFKYMEPFSLDIFHHAEDIRNKTDSLVIWNKTGKECVVIAYFKRVYNAVTKKYIANSYNNMLTIYALYIPPGESVSMDFRMQLLRFYMGKRLASFNTYKDHIYPDTGDLKFSKFTSADSMLFSKGFVFYYADSLKAKRTVLTISQPSVYSYQLSWTGKVPLTQYVGFAGEISGKYLDSAMIDKPLILDSREKMDRQAVTLQEKVDAFMNY